MHPENLDANRDMEILVAEYETMKQRGEVAFLEERSFHRLVSYYERENQLDQALEAVDHALVHYGFSADFYTKKAQLLIDLQRDQEALDALEEAELYAPAEPEIALLRIELLAYQGRHDQALDLIAALKTQASSADMVEVLLTESLVYECQSEFEAMFYVLSSALSLEPSHAETLDRFWLSMEATRKYEEGLPLLDKVLDENAYRHMAWFYTGHAHAYLGDYRKAIEAYEYAFLSAPDFEEGYRECANLCFELQQYSRALSIYEEMLERFEADSDLFFQMGQCYQAQDQNQMARTLFQEALRMDPMDDEELFQLGNSFALEGKWKQAVRFYKKAITIENKQEEYYAALAQACRMQEQWDEAETYIRLAITQAMSEARYWVAFALILLEQNKAEQALELLEEAEEYTTGSELLYCKVACLIGSGRRNEALYWLGEALREDFEMHPFLFDLAPGLRSDNGVLSVISYHMDR
jgi:tetratricopeptide (TPR) repeat protein